MLSATPMRNGALYFVSRTNRSTRPKSKRQSMPESAALPIGEHA